MPTKREKQGTIHELESQLADIEMMDEYHPHTKKQIIKYRKIFNDLGLFPKGADLKKKNEIISRLKITNFDEDKIVETQKQLKAIEGYNRAIERERRKLEDEASAGKNMVKNEKILKKGSQERVAVNISDKIRGELKIYDKELKLSKYTLEPQKNKIKYYSGQDYNFVIRNGFGRALVISYNKLQKIRKEENVIEYVLKQFERDVEDTYKKDEAKLEKSKNKEDRQKWKHKKKVYKKILNEVIDHNMQIATNKKYNKPFQILDDEGDVVNKDSRIPVLMEIEEENIRLFIP